QRTRRTKLSSWCSPRFSPRLRGEIHSSHRSEGLRDWCDFFPRDVETARRAPTIPRKAHTSCETRKEEQKMKYILMMNCPKNGYESFGSWAQKDIQAHIGFMMGLNKALGESGEL